MYSTVLGKAKNERHKYADNNIEAKWSKRCIVETSSDALIKTLTAGAG